MPRSRPARSARRTGVCSLVAAGAIALALSGCTGAPEPTPTPSTPTDIAEPIFASDEEALAAAEAAYKAFEDVSQQIAADGGEDVERVESVASSNYVPTLLDEFAQYRELGLRIEGESSTDSMKLAEYREDEAGAVVSIYVCRDVTAVRVLDSSGADVTPAERDNRTPLLAFLVAESNESDLLVDGVDLWSGDDFC